MIEFKNGKHYLYFEVPKDEFDSLVNAESVGSYFETEIKPEYECMKVSKDEDDEFDEEITNIDEAEEEN
mgnify:CR=1 FL=1